MIDYRLRVYRRYPQKQMKQVIIYLRKTTSELAQQNNFRLEKTYHEFEVIRLWEQPSELFMNQLGLLPLAVLSSAENPKIVLTQIAQTIKEESDTTTMYFDRTFHFVVMPLGIYSSDDIILQ